MKGSSCVRCPKPECEAPIPPAFPCTPLGSPCMKIIYNCPRGNHNDQKGCLILGLFRPEHVIIFELAVLIFLSCWH